MTKTKEITNVLVPSSGRVLALPISPPLRCKPPRHTGPYANSGRRFLLSHPPGPLMQHTYRSCACSYHRTVAGGKTQSSYMNDPLAVINEECGVISDSQEQLLHHLPFLGENPIVAAAQEELEFEKATTSSSHLPRDDQRTISRIIQLGEDKVSVQSRERSTVSKSPAVAVSSPTKSPVNLADVFKLLPRKDGHRSYERVDILGIAARKGINLCQPLRWWRPEGYDE